MVAWFSGSARVIAWPGQRAYEVNSGGRPRAIEVNSGGRARAG
jgi:hypothetical protein